jgi:hypothetical protein
VNEAEQTDAFGNALTECGFWCCTQTFRPSGEQRFCSRGCKQADSKRRSRKADSTRERRRAAGKKEGFEEGVLYVIRPGDETIVKVGYSKSLTERLRILQTAHYHTLKAIATIPVKRYFKNDPPDKEVHMLLHEGDHVRGEWWALTENTVEVLTDFGFALGGTAIRPSPDGHDS